MNKKTILTVMLAAIFAVGLQAGTAAAQEHPEHPTKGKSAEHPEHPSKPAEHPEHPTKMMPAPSIDQVADFITTYVDSTVADDKGYMKVKDDKNHKTISVKLDHVHRERLAKIAEGVYFVCADFKDHKGKLYDLDFWVKQGPLGLAVTETMIHKEAGKPRYTWYEKKGIWKQKKVK